MVIVVVMLDFVLSFSPTITVTRSPLFLHRLLYIHAFIEVLLDPLLIVHHQFTRLSKDSMELC